MNTVLEIESLLDKCYGCFACSNACPKSAIVMRSDSAGFLYPEIAGACISCGICRNMCPITALEEPRNAEVVECHWAYSKNTWVRESSSSGGFFYEIASLVIRSGGVVFGAGVKEMRVAHMAVKTLEELHALMRSKYVQSHVDNTYAQAKQYLTKGIPVMFSGTPCQILGLTRYLGKQYDNLLTVDFVCHGVPSHDLYEKMIGYYEERYGKKVVDLTFREKDLGWRHQVIKLYFEDGAVKRIRSRDSVFYVSFLENLSLRKSCYSCRLPQGHVADITMADFWAKNDPENKGISFVALNTERGRRAYGEIRSSLCEGDACLDDATGAFVAHGEFNGYDLKKRDEFFATLSHKGYGGIQRKMVFKIVRNRLVLLKSALWHLLSRIKKFLRGKMNG